MTLNDIMLRAAESYRTHRRKPLVRWLEKYGEYLSFPVGLLIFFLVWQGTVELYHYPPFVLPAPADVAHKFVLMSKDGSLLYHTVFTLKEIALGLLLGLVTATTIGYLLAKSSLLEHLLAPYIVASQSIPVIAIAPLFIIWFGFGSTSKVIICALTVFFPTLVNTLVGIRSVDDDLRDLMRSLNASRWQTLTMLEIPASMPVLLGGFKVSVTLAVIGAVVGEFIGADRGLGFLINVAKGTLDTPLLFVVIFTLVIIALVLYLSVVFLERELLRWQRAK